MTLKNEIKILILILTFTFATSTIILNISANIKQSNKVQEIKEDKNLKKAGFWSETQININDTNPALNWETTKNTYAWCSKVGGIYIIENVTVDATGKWAGFIIQDSDAYFIVRNCTVFGADFDDAYGMYLENVSNGIVTDNEFRDNDGDGIRFTSSSHYCKNNTISNNNFKNCGLDIHTYGEGNGTAYFTDNYILSNSFRNCILSIGAIINAESDENARAYCINNTISGNNVTEKSGEYGIELFAEAEGEGPSNPHPDAEAHFINNTIIGNNITKAYGGILLQAFLEGGKAYCNNNTVKLNVINETTDGITLSYAHNNTISKNSANNNTNGIFLEYSHDNDILNNSANDNYYCGIRLRYSNYNNVSLNTLLRNAFCIRDEYCVSNIYNDNGGCQVTYIKDKVSGSTDDDDDPRLAIPGYDLLTFLGILLISYSIGTIIIMRKRLESQN